ncbi:MAG: prolipoprotein diacylglyceryl transferase [Planctomycetes bacterium]|nr:prolipoprotein diacylglyceryl transferase [Planctomycetota bacterium]MCK5473747.1 prolipoprotein diacylglyceryl transferase [Planctomycetota bacterium]
MFPELFKIPFTDLTIKSYGTMMVIGFLLAVFLIRRLSRNITPNATLITNAALYALIGGIFGARLFYVIHYFDQFRGNLLSAFAIWRGGLELLGGLLAIVVIFFYLRRHKLPVRRYIDILAIGIMLALSFGRIGCFLNGCCFGKPTDLSCGVQFPYGSFAYHSQIEPDLARNRPEPLLELPKDFFGYSYKDGVLSSGLLPYEDLTAEQKQMVSSGQYQCLPVHPTQLYSSAAGGLWCVILYFFWRRGQKINDVKKINGIFKSGCTFGLMFILYGLGRFFIEFLRDDNPIEFDGITISQNISIALVVLGIVLMIIFGKMKQD